jgi:hypothetical protein
VKTAECLATLNAYRSAAHWSDLEHLLKIHQHPNRIVTGREADTPSVIAIHDPFFERKPKAPYDYR